MEKSNRITSVSNGAVALGVVLQLVGLVWDIRVHEMDAELAVHESVFTLSNPGHVLIFGGLGLAVAGIVARQVFAARSRSLILGAAAPVGLALLAAATLAYTLTTPMNHGAADHHETDASAASELEGLSPEDAALVGESRHDHHQEVVIGVDEIVRLNEQLSALRQGTAKYEDISQAIRDGYAQVTQDIPLIGAHFINPAHVADGVFDASRPEMLIYTNVDGKWELFGASFITKLLVRGEEEAPEGFAGPFDVWHWHSNWCFTVQGARVTSGPECSASRGFFVPRMGYMVHAWLRDNPNGVFSHSHPDLKGSDAKIFDPAGLFRLLALVSDR
jgi:hypothetical protein